MSYGSVTPLNRAGLITELRFDVSDPGDDQRQLIYGLQAYALVRKHNQDLPDALFGHGPDRNARSLVRWGGGRGTIRMLGLGPEGRALLLENFGPVADTLRRIYGRTVRMQLLDHIAGLGLIDDGRVRSYVVRSMVVATQDAHKAFYDTASDEQRAEFIAKKIRTGIEMQAHRLGIAGPDGQGLPRYIITNVQSPSFAPVRAKIIAGNSRWAFVVSTVTFYSNLRIDGPWAVGGITSKGYGRLSRNNRAARTSANEVGVTAVRSAHVPA